MITPGESLGATQMNGGKTRETWREWQAPDIIEPPLVTRAELLNTLDRLGLNDINERALRFWETKGVLPAPVRRRFNGATRALYPPWMVNLVFSLRHLQARGFALDALPLQMRVLGWAFSRAESVLADVHDNDKWRTWPIPAFPFKRRVNEEMERTYDVALTDLLWRYANDLEPLEGLRYVRAEVTLVDEYGARKSFTLP